MSKNKLLQKHLFRYDITATLIGWLCGFK